MSHPLNIAPEKEFNLDEHLFYMLARDYFRRTRQGSWTRSQVVARLEKIQDEVKRRLAGGGDDPPRAA